MNIKEAYAKATPLPVAAVAHEIIRDGKVMAFCYDHKRGVLAEHNAALLAHAFNVLPEVLEALHDMKDMACSVRGGGYLSIKATQQAVDRCIAVIAKASEVKV